MKSVVRLELFALPGLPLVEPGTDLAEIVLSGLKSCDQQLQTGDIVVVAQKIVSKAEGRYVRLSEIEPSVAAQSLAAETGKDPRLAELILRESRAVIRQRPGVIVVEHKLGYIMANAGIDASNVSFDGSESRVLLLPVSPDASAAKLRADLQTRSRSEIGVIINDSFGRAWRNGAIGTCLGSAGIPALKDLRGELDLFGRALQVTTMGVADELSSAASLLQGQANEGLPVVIVRGFRWSPSDQTGRNLIRELHEDMFR